MCFLFLIRIVDSCDNCGAWFQVSCMLPLKLREFLDYYAQPYTAFNGCANI